MTALALCRYKNMNVEDDKQVQMLVDSQARVVTLVGKSWDLHVDEVLVTSREENLAMIRDTVRYLRAKGIEIMLDAEHFYDGHRANSEYAMECLAAAVEAIRWAGRRSCHTAAGRPSPPGDASTPGSSDNLMAACGESS